MNGLEQTFYIMAIVFMSLMFILMIAIVVAIFVIKAKINKIHQQIDEKIDQLTNFAEYGGALTAQAGKQVLNQAKKAITKATKKKR
jgi:cell division protein FtsL